MRNGEALYYYTPSGLPGEAVAYVRGGHPGYPLDRGMPVTDWLTPHFDIGGFDEATGKRTSYGTLTSFLNNSVAWLIVNREVRASLTEAGISPKEVQWLDVCLHQGGQERVGEYFAANVLDIRSAANPRRSRYVGEGPQRSLFIVVLLAEVVRGAEMLGLREWPGRIYFSGRLKRILDRAGVTGVEWEATEVAE